MYLKFTDLPNKQDRKMKWIVESMQSYAQKKLGKSIRKAKEHKKTGLYEARKCIKKWLAIGEKEKEN